MYAWGEVALERSMCSAVRRRMLENGTTRSVAGRKTAVAADWVVAAGTGAGGAWGAGAGAGAGAGGAWGAGAGAAACAGGAWGAGAGAGGAWVAGAGGAWGA